MDSVESIKKHILQKVSIETVIGEYVSLKKMSGRLVGCCPFHDENTPSFVVFSDHYHCFGCGVHGDVITFLREHRGYGFIEVLKILAERLGLDTGALNPKGEDQSSWKKKLLVSQIYNIANKFFVQSLKSTEGKEALEYLQNRGFSKKQIDEFGFGWAPRAKDSLCQYLLKSGYTADQIAECSLGNFFRGRGVDFFQSRVLIPIRGSRGDLLAFGGRAIKGETPKYKNSRYDKKKVLFGLDKARDTIKAKGRAIIVEGYMDALSLWAGGFEEAVACQGTSLTLQHIKSVEGLTSFVYLVFDGDVAGRSANFKLLEHALQFTRLSFKVVLLPEGSDPDTYIREKGKESFDKILKQAVGLLDFTISSRLKSLGEEHAPKIINEEFIPWLRQVEDPIVKSYLLKKISTYTGVSEHLLIASSKVSSLQKSSFFQEDIKKSALEDPSPAIYDLIGHLFFAQPEDIRGTQLPTRIRKCYTSAAGWDELIEKLLTQLENNESPGKNDLLELGSGNNLIFHDFLQDLLAQRKAFLCSSRSQQIHRGVQALRKDIVTKCIKDLKSQVVTSRFESEEDMFLWKKVANEVTNLTKELDEIDLENL